MFEHVHNLQSEDTAIDVYLLSTNYFVLRDYQVRGGVTDSHVIAKVPVSKENSLEVG